MTAGLYLAASLYLCHLQRSSDHATFISGGAALVKICPDPQQPGLVIRVPFWIACPQFNAISGSTHALSSDFSLVPGAPCHPSLMTHCTVHNRLRAMAKVVPAHHFTHTPLPDPVAAALSSSTPWVRVLPSVCRAPHLTPAPDSHTSHWQPAAGVWSWSWSTTHEGRQGGRCCEPLQILPPFPCPPCSRHIHNRQ